MADSQHLIRRLLDTPEIARVVPRLAPGLLHRIIDRAGLEASIDLVVLATPRQLQRLLDIDLWRPAAPGGDDTLDAARFGEWLEVLAQLDADAAGDRLASMELALVVGGLSAHMRVFDAVTVMSYTMLHGEQIRGRTFGSQAVEIGGYAIEGRSSPVWEAIVDLLVELHGHRPELFNALMRGCVAVSSGTREEDGFHTLLEDRDQHRAGLAAARAERRERQGYVAAAEARAFLQAARRTATTGARPIINPIARACFRDLAADPMPGTDSTPVSAFEAPAVAGVMEILSGEGLLPHPRALLGTGSADTRLALVHAYAESRMGAQEELAFLVNVLIAGCSLQDRPFTVREASDAVAATCNLGLENWPAAWSEPDLITAFQLGWTVLHLDVARHAAAAVRDVVARHHCSDEDVQSVRPALDEILMLDGPAWAVLRAALDECPTLHTSLLSTRALRIDPAAVTFIARSSEIAILREWLTSLPSVLT